MHLFSAISPALKPAASQTGVKERADRYGTTGKTRQVDFPGLKTFVQTTTLMKYANMAQLGSHGPIRTSGHMLPRFALSEAFRLSDLPYPTLHGSYPWLFTLMSNPPICSDELLAGGSAISGRCTVRISLYCSPGPDLWKRTRLEFISFASSSRSVFISHVTRLLFRRRWNSMSSLIVPTSATSLNTQYQLDTRATAMSLKWLPENMIPRMFLRKLPRSA